jgi:hypothetical protein
MRVRCYVGRSVQLSYLGHSLAGLFDQPDCSVTLEIVDWVGDAQCIAIDVDGTRLVIEVYDQTDLWNLELLDWCDVYAKRNIDPLRAGPMAHKVIPYGMNLASHSKRSVLAVLAAMAAAFPSGFRPRLSAIYCYVVTPHWMDFEHDPSMPVEDEILYQTRVWDPVDSAEDTSINDERIALLRALRAEFKHRLVGGVVPNDYARRKYPDLITRIPSRHRQYISSAKRPAIAIYSRGLFGSIAFKMPEYLAASKCIVSDPITNLLPSPLSHVLQYSSAEECVARCQAALSSRDLIRYQRERSWSYYKEHVRCPTAIRRILDIAKQWK